MNYYEHHIGDYQRKTAHLSLAEHGAYSLMLQTFYATERALPADRKVLYRLLRADTAAERKAVDSIASQFWQPTTVGLINKRAEEVLNAYRRWLDQQKANGTRGGRPRQTHGLSGDKPNDNPSVSETVTQTKPNGGDHARVPLPTPHLDHDLDTHPTPTPPKGGAGFGRRSPARAEKDAALEVWHQLTASNGTQPPRDPRLQAAIDAVGGWARISQRERGIDDQRVQRDFVEAYRGAS
jgi:uncharacterized protein YdaU (DUF1376 family)